MKKILATTDFSEHSEAGMRFAIQMARQSGSALVFYHGFHFPKRTSWSEAEYSVRMRLEKANLTERLERLVKELYDEMKIQPGKYKCVVAGSIFAESGIRSYAEENKFSFICISTRGSGLLKKILGTTAGNLIAHSQVPVFVVPHRFRPGKVKTVVYASDLENFKPEFRRVLALASNIGAEAGVLHVAFSNEREERKEVEKSAARMAKKAVRVHWVEVKGRGALYPHLRKKVNALRPSLLVMFTNQSKTLFSKLFNSGSSEKMSFQTKLPLLVFNKSAI